MRCNTLCGVALPLAGLLSAVAVFASQSSQMTGSSLPAASGMVLVNTRGVEVNSDIKQADITSPAAINMNGWQETAVRRGSIRRL